jgi:hypothetical protein
LCLSVGLSVVCFFLKMYRNHVLGELCDGRAGFMLQNFSDMSQFFWRIEAFKEDPYLDISA